MECRKQLEGQLYCQNCNFKDALEGEITDLQEFSNLRGINASNNNFTNLDFLTTLPNKDKLKSLNLYGNQIKEVDFAELFNNFPKLEKVNFQNNPLSAKNLSALTSEQFGFLIKGIKEKKININSFKGTVLMDLLEYAQRSASQGNPQFQAHIQTLNEVSQPTQPKTEKENSGSDNTPLFIGGSVLLVISAVVVGYYLSKRKNNVKES